MEDLTLDSFAYLRFPLALAAIAFLVGAAGALRAGSRRAFLASAAMMVLFFQAARLAMVKFDPLLSSRPLAQAILDGPPGTIIFDSQYYTFSSVAFYTNRPELLLNGRWNNLEYGSYAPGSPRVFISDPEFKELWLNPARYYLVTKLSATYPGSQSWWAKRGYTSRPSAGVRPSIQIILLLNLLIGQMKRAN